MNGNLEENLIDKNEKILSRISNFTLILLISISTLVMIAELVGGFYAKSLSIMSDAINTLPDISIFIVSYICQSFSVSKSSKITYGYYRIEILAFLMTAAIVWGLSLWVFYESIRKITSENEINSEFMILSALVGFVYNLIIWLLIGIKQKTSSKNSKIFYFTMKTRYTHFLIDFIESLVIILTSILIYFYPWLKVIDPVCAIILIFIVLVYTGRASLESINILMESTPVELNLQSLTQSLRSIKGVSEIHDLHVWSLNLGKKVMSCHIIADDPSEVLSNATKLCTEKFKITHTTIQVEKKTNSLDCSISLKLK